VPLIDQEKSFAEFVCRPENQRLAEQAQREEVEEKLRTDERLRFLEFREKVHDQVSALQLLSGPSTSDL